MTDIESIEKQMSELEGKRKELLIAKFCDEGAINEYKAKVGRRVKKHRQKQNFTQEELASYLQMNRSNLANIEAGRIDMSLSTIWKLCKSLKVNPNVLLQ